MRQSSHGRSQVGDLEGILVHKFSYKKQLYLMAYHLPETHDATPKADEDDAEQEGPQFLFMDFYQIGSHENFYDDLKAYLSRWMVQMNVIHTAEQLFLSLKQLPSAERDKFFCLVGQQGVCR